MKPVLLAFVLSLVYGGWAVAQCPACPPAAAGLVSAPAGYVQAPVLLPPPTLIAAPVVRSSFSSYSSTTTTFGAVASAGARRVGMRERHLQNKLARVQRRHGA